MTYSPKNEWIEYCLPDAFWFQEGPGVRNWQFTKFGIKLLNVANITTLNTIDLSKTDRCLSVEEVEKKYKHFLVDEQDLVIASSGVPFDSDGLLRTRAAFVRKEHLPLCMNTSTIRFKSKKGVSNLRFLRFWFDSFEFRTQITRLVTGSAQQNFGPSHLKLLSIRLPALSEQQRIAAILERADRLRRQRRYALQLSETFLQSIFLKMFGDESAKGFEREVLEEISEVQGGLQLSKSRDRHELKLPYLRVANVYTNRLNLSEIKRIGLTEQEFHRVKLQKGDILIVEGHGNISEIGRCAIWDGSVENCVHQNHLIRVRVNSKIIQSIYLNYYINFLGRSYFNEASNTTSGLNTISTGVVKQFAVPIPPLSLQKEFASIINCYIRLQSQQREAERQAEHLFQTLLHRAFRGEL